MTAIGPQLGTPGIERRDDVLVTGPWLAGVTGVVAALQRAAAQADIHRVDGPGDRRGADGGGVRRLRGRAALTDIRLRAARRGAAENRRGDRRGVQDRRASATGKTSWPATARCWRRTRRATATCSGSGSPPRPRWASRASTTSPTTVSAHLADADARAAKQVAGVEIPATDRRRPIRSRRRWRGPPSAGRGIAGQRSAILRQRRLSKSERTIALRSQTQQARVQLSYFARNRCASVRSRAAGRRRESEPPADCRSSRPARRRPRLRGVIAEVDEGTTTHLAEVAQTLGLDDRPAAPLHRCPTVDLPAPPLKSRKLETRLMMLVGAGFGLGVALTLSRLLADLTPGLHRWPGRRVRGDRTGAHRLGGRHPRAASRPRLAGPMGRRSRPRSLQSAVEQLVATRVLAAESIADRRSRRAGRSARAHRWPSRSASSTPSCASTPLRGARAAALRGREMPTLQAALDGGAGRTRRA